MDDARLARSFDDIPLIDTPDDFAFVMPSFLARMAVEHGPIFRRAVPPPLWPVLGPSVVHMVGPEANRFVLQAHRHVFSHDQGWSPILLDMFARGLLNTDDPVHTRHRKMMNPAFAAAYMDVYLPTMQRIIAARADDWAVRGEIDLYEEARKITFDVAAETLAGFHTGAEVDRLRALFYTLVQAPNDVRDQYFTRVMSARAELDAMLLEMIAVQRRAPGDTILGLLARARDEEGRVFDDRELLGHLHILLVAGHETSTTLAAWMVYLLATHPAYLARVQAELDAARGDGNADGGSSGPAALTLRDLRMLRASGYALDEAARLYTPTGNLPRVTVEETVFGGYRIPAGTRVLLSIAAGHRLPHVFHAPDMFDPDRFAPPREEDKRTPYALATFGGGPRACIGSSFARVEILALTAHILRAYTLTPVDGQQIVQAHYIATASVPHGIRVRVAPRPVQ